MKKVLFSFLIAAICFTVSCNSGPDSKKDAVEDNKEKFNSTDLQDDIKFAVAAADGGRLEVELGKLAQSNAASKQVKDFGQQMISDHGKAGEELAALAASKNITLPATLGAKHQQSYDDLAKKKGADFDKAYASFMVDDHKEDIEEFTKEAEKGKDADLKNWASGKIPVLQHHLMMAQSADSTAKKNK
jgi:putative membrane protein